MNDDQVDKGGHQGSPLPEDDTAVIPPPPRASTSDFVVSTEDLGGIDVSERVSHLEEAQKVPLVRAVGSQENFEAQATKSAASKNMATLAAAGFGGGVVAALLGRLIPEDAPVFAANLAFTAILIFCVSLAVTLTDAARTGSGEKVKKAALLAIPIALGASLVFGLVAHLLYTSMVEPLVNAAFDDLESGAKTQAQAESYIELWLHPIRGLAWAIVGAGAGLTVGAVSKSSRRTVITVIGGAIGGFLGGFLFDFIAQSEGTEFLAQIVGMGLTGLLVGLAIGALEEARKSAWIEIAAGGMAGKQFIIYQDAVTIGSSPNCNITVIKDPGVEPEAAVIRLGRGEPEASATGAGVLNIDGRMQQRATLRDGSTITLGSTVLIFREKSKDQTQVGSIRR